MVLVEETFAYLSPSIEQGQDMDVVRKAGAAYADVLDKVLPDGPDKAYALRKLREVVMWANVAITRLADGTPRGGD